MIFRPGELKIDKETAGRITQALTFSLIILKKYCMLPKYCEKFNFIIDLGGNYMKPQNV